MTTSDIQAAGQAPDPRRWAALVVLLTGAFLAPLDFFIVNIAMPAIHQGLRTSPGEIQLVMSGYALVFAVLLITGGRLGDIFGRKRVFLAGLTGFAAASALCGLAWSPLSLIVGRLLQALAAALMAPQALASIHALFPPEERGRALSIYGITLGLSSVAGQLLGGALVGANLGGLGWRLIFLINLPIVIAAIIAALPLLKETRSPQRPHLDWGGVILSALALTAFVLPLIEGREQGWPSWTIASLIVTPVLLELFRRYEIGLARMGGDPLVAIEIFRTPGILRGLAAVGMLYALAAFFLTFSLYLQQALGRNALQAGMAIIPFSVGFIVASTASPAIGRRLGAASSSAGFLISATGLVATSRLVDAAPAGLMPPALLILPALFVIGFGMGLSIPTMMRVIVERMEPRRAGLVGGLVNSMLQVSAALGVAVIGGIYYGVLDGRSDPAAIAHAFAIALLAIAACHLTGAAFARGLGARQRRPANPILEVSAKCPNG